jgi:hypothetical protein
MIVALEKHFDVTIHDDEITAEAFETVGSLAEFVRARLRAQQMASRPHNPPSSADDAQLGALAAGFALDPSRRSVVDRRAGTRPSASK